MREFTERTSKMLEEARRRWDITYFLGELNLCGKDESSIVIPTGILADDSLPNV